MEAGEMTTVIALEQYASRVLDFSTQYGADSSISYTAFNIIGSPSQFPSYGDFPQTYVMRTYGTWWKKSPSGKYYKSGNFSESFIDLQYQESVYVHAIYVYETFHPGSVCRIWALSSMSQWNLLWKAREKVSFAGHKPRIFSPPLQSSNFRTNIIRIEFDSSSLPYYTSIDAVALLGSFSPESLEAKLITGYPKDSQVILRSVLRRKLYERPLSKLSLDLVNLGQSFLQSLPRESSHNGYFDSLPTEILLLIFQYLSLLEVIRAGEVCRLFRQMSFDPILYTKINLSSIFYCISNESLLCLKPRCSYLQNVDLSKCGNYGKMTTSSLKDFILNCSRTLNVLRLDNCHVVDETFLQVLGESCPFLSELSLSNCHSLPSSSFTHLFPLTQIRVLNLYRTSITGTTLASILFRNKDLEVLNVSACANINGDEICKYLSEKNEKLIAIDLWKCSSLTSLGISYLSTLSFLQECDFGWCSGISPRSLTHLILQSPSLSKIFLSAHRLFSDTELYALDTATHLEQLDIMGARNVSPEGISHLLASHGNLKLLDISYCTQIEEHNYLLLEWRKNYPNTHIVTAFN